ncbi:MarR family winged helix-turn-helix transcriptional regulator [Zhihengliuella halotolerans]|uniref:DNA-binding MarR family transcriptional regulator n=1 Tax=Zhihengliuella halotolerans TaxID=370736 RepID=A0A4Q8AFR5_9MICC|nr:MarR family transcriptional regulator [Zhihengliuella halotolerans]RZU63084.1 DNA-binding MarR family transcriptional regulator [Zhihengliuella halotolerans]
MEARDPLALESQVCFALAVASRSVIAAYRPVLEPLRLTHPQYLVMLALWESAPLSLKEIGSLLKLDPGTVSPLVKRLETLGYIDRLRDPDDERSLAITLTRRGANLRAEAEKVPVEMMKRLGLDEEELVTLHRAMTRLILASESG